MPTADDSEIYRQRYENFRHFDRMRFQLLQILVAFGAAVVLFLRFRPELPEWSMLMPTGSMLLLTGFALLRVSNGLWANNKVLRGIAERIGDTDIPEHAPKWKSVWFWLSVAVLTLAGMLLLLGVASLIF